MTRLGGAPASDLDGRAGTLRVHELLGQQEHAPGSDLDGRAGTLRVHELLGQQEHTSAST